MLARRQPERNVGRRLVDRVLDGNLDPALELADVVHVCVEARPVPGAELLLERAELADDRVEDARVPPPVAHALLEARAVAEQPLEHDARVGLRRQRFGGRRPRNRVGVGAAVSPVAVAVVARVLDAELERRQDGVLAVPGRDHLIDRRTEKRAHGVAPRTRTREQHGAAGVIAARFLVGGHRLGHVQPGDEHDPIAQRLERLGDERELEVLSLLQRAPKAGSRAVRVPDADEAPYRRSGCQPRGRQRRYHRLEQRQGQGDAGAAQEGPPRDVVLRHVHRLAPRRSACRPGACRALTVCPAPARGPSPASGTARSGRH